MLRENIERQKEQEGEDARNDEHRTRQADPVTNQPTDAYPTYTMMIAH